MATLFTTTVHESITFGTTNESEMVNGYNVLVHCESCGQSAWRRSLGRFLGTASDNAIYIRDYNALCSDLRFNDWMADESGVQCPACIAEAAYFGTLGDEIMVARAGGVY